MTSTVGGIIDPEPVARLVKNGKIVNRILASICGQEDMSKFGVKAELQNRIIEKLYAYAACNDAFRFDRLKTMIESPSVIPQVGYYTHVVATVSSGPPIPAKAMPVAPNPHSGIVYGSPFSNNLGGYYFSSHGNQVIQLRPSPYYNILEQLGPTVLCDVMGSHRYTAKIPLSVSQYPALSRISSESDLRVMIFGSPGGVAPQYIAFPHQSELKVNGGEVKANLRGLKNKPGSTRPIDITDSIRFNPPTYVNNIEMTYALTSKRFYLMAALIRSISVTKLVQILAEGQKITQSSVKADMINKSRDSDIVTTASVLSLKCPLSTTRIDLPCRSTSCRHNQCFDATSYLQLQQQGPTWCCPICNKHAPFESLAVDDYVYDILQKTSKSTDQVTIQPNGEWELNEKKDTSLPKNRDSSINSSDEVIEIINPDSTSQTFLETQTPNLNSRSSRTPLNISSRESSKKSGLSGTKRPIATIIDLTSSADEDEEPLSRPLKRRFTGHNPSAPLISANCPLPASHETSKT